MISWQNRFAFNPQVALYAFGVFLFFAFFMGGGSRDDVQSLIILRPLAILFAAYALMYKLDQKIKWHFFPITIISLLAISMIIQLIALPPEIWSKLPRRQIYVDIANLANIEQPWRPISLSPSKTWNSLFSLSVPIAAMTLFMNIQRQDRKKAIIIIMAFISISAFWGALQSIGGSRSPLYLYRITNEGAAVGLFANRNHHSFMLVSLIIISGWYSYILQQKHKSNQLKLSLTMGIIFVLIPMIFITGSRAGLILMIPALAVALYLFYQGSRGKRILMAKNLDTSPKTYGIKKLIQQNSDKITLITIVVLMVSLAIGAILLSRSLAFDRLFLRNDITELRLEILPILLTMIKDYMPFGAGFGSFEHVYKIYEPISFLSPAYFNQAHNDWIQFLIEGGIFSALILLIMMVWFVFNIGTVLLKWRQLDDKKYTILMCSAYFMVLAFASVGDYPLRVPSVMCVTAVIFTYFNQKMFEIRT